MDLGDAGRKTIKGHDRDYYVGILHEVREKTLAEFQKKDDAWLMAANKDLDWGLDEQSVQVVPRLRTRSAPHRADRDAAQDACRARKPTARLGGA